MENELNEGAPEAPESPESIKLLRWAQHHFITNWEAIVRPPVLIVIAVIGYFAYSFGALKNFERISIRDDRINFLNDQIAAYKDRTKSETPDAAGKKIEDLKTELAQTREDFNKAVKKNYDSMSDRISDIEPLELDSLQETTLKSEIKMTNTPLSYNIVVDIQCKRCKKLTDQLINIVRNNNSTTIPSVIVGPERVAKSGIGISYRSKEIGSLVLSAFSKSDIKYDNFGLFEHERGDVDVKIQINDHFVAAAPP